MPRVFGGSKSFLYCGDRTLIDVGVLTKAFVHYLFAILLKNLLIELAGVECDRALKEEDYEVDANAQVWRLRGVAVEGWLVLLDKKE